MFFDFFFVDSSPQKRFKNVQKALALISFRLQILQTLWFYWVFVKHVDKLPVLQASRPTKLKKHIGIILYNQARATVKPTLGYWAISSGPARPSTRKSSYMCKQHSCYSVFTGKIKALVVLCCPWGVRWKDKLKKTLLLLCFPGENLKTVGVVMFPCLRK